MKFLALFSLVFAIFVCTVSGNGGYKKPIKFKRCETATINAVKYVTKPTVIPTYVTKVLTTKIPSTYKVDITSVSTYVDYSTICNKPYRH